MQTSADSNVLAEQEQAAILKARDYLLHLPLSIQPDELPSNEATKTFDAQSVYVRNRIKRHQTELTEAWRNGCFSTVLEQHGLRENLVSPAVVKQCLCELMVEDELRQQLFYHYQPAHEKYDPDAPSIEQQAAEYQLSMVKPDTERGHYVGLMVGRDYRAALIKFASNKALELPFWVLAEGHSMPCFGDTVHVKFSQGALTVSVFQRPNSFAAKV